MGTCLYTIAMLPVSDFYRKSKGLKDSIKQSSLIGSCIGLARRRHRTSKAVSFQAIADHSNVRV